MSPSTLESARQKPAFQKQFFRVLFLEDAGEGLVVGTILAGRRRVEFGQDVRVELVFDPPWDVSRLSDVARLELGMM